MIWAKRTAKSIFWREDHTLRKNIKEHEYIIAQFKAALNLMDP